MTDRVEDETRIAATASKVTRFLVSHFSYDEVEARQLFDTFRSAIRDRGGWTEPDYYDHEGPESIALEVEFHQRVGDAARRVDFIEFRRQFYSGLRGN